MEIRNTSGAAINIINAAKTVFVLAEDTENTVTDGETYTFADPLVNEPNAVIFSESDFNPVGAGILTVSGNTNDGIASKDGLIIASGTIAVNAVDDGIRGKDYLVVNAEGDGLKSDNEEDAVHSNAGMLINAGSFNIASGDDGMYADSTLEINGGDIHITQSYEGIESVVITINGGIIHIVSSDDGINVAGGNDGSGMGPGGQRPGSSGMAMVPSASSSQASALIYFSSTLPANTLVHIQNNSGEDILTFSPTKPYKSIAVSSPKLVQGAVYTIFTRGSSTGISECGLPARNPIYQFNRIRHGHDDRYRRRARSSLRSFIYKK